MFEAEDGHAEVYEDDALCSEGEGAHEVLYCDLQHRRQVVVGVVGHHDTAKQDCHDSCNKRETLYIHYKHKALV